MSKGGETVLEHLKSCVIVCGHYGAGKTNLTVNLALAAAQSGEAVSVIDMDIVNPYFRTASTQTPTWTCQCCPPAWERLSGRRPDGFFWM